MKKKILVYVDEDLLKKFRRLAFMKFRKFRGPLSRAVEEAMDMWVRKEERRHTHTSSGTQTSAKRYQKSFFGPITGKRLFELMYDLYKMFGDSDAELLYVPRNTIVKLIRRKRGHHPKTINRYITGLLDLHVLFLRDESHPNTSDFDLWVPKLREYFSKNLNGYLEEEHAGKQD